MTGDWERTVPPHPRPGCVISVSTVSERRRLMRSDWLILSRTLLLSLHSVQSELSCNLSQSRSAWLQSHKTSKSISLKKLSAPTIHQLLQFTLHSALIRKASLCTQEISLQQRGTSSVQVSFLKWLRSTILLFSLLFFWHIGIKMHVCIWGRTQRKFLANLTRLSLHQANYLLRRNLRY